MVKDKQSSYSPNKTGLEPIFFALLLCHFPDDPTPFYTSTKHPLFIFYRPILLTLLTSSD